MTVPELIGLKLEKGVKISSRYNGCQFMCSLWTGATQTHYSSQCVLSRFFNLLFGTTYRAPAQSTLQLNAILLLTC